MTIIYFETLDDPGIILLSKQVFRRGRPRTIYISLPQFTYKKASIPNLSPIWLFMSNALDQCHPEFQI